MKVIRKKKPATTGENSMEYRIVRSKQEIEEVMDRCFKAESEGSAYPGMTYEQGIMAVIDWLTDPTQDPPFDE